MHRKLIAGVVLAAVLSAPLTAFAAIGPKSWSKCDIYEWLGIVNVMACEGPPEG